MPACSGVSPPFTAPPGNTHAPPMKRASGLRRTSSTSGPSGASRRTITDAAGRAGVSGPSFSSSPEAGRLTATRFTLQAVERVTFRADERDDHPAAVDLRVVRVHLRPGGGRPRRRRARRDAVRGDPGRLGVPRVWGAEEGLLAAGLRGRG